MTQPFFETASAFLKGVGGGFENTLSERDRLWVEAVFLSFYVTQFTFCV